MDDRQSYNLIFLPGFSMAEKVSDVSGRGVGMDVVRTNIQKLNGTIEIRSQLGKGTTLVINLPLTLAILPVLLVRLGDQPFAVPLSMVREILPIDPAGIQDVGGKATMVVRGEVRANAFTPDNAGLSPFMQRLARAHADAARPRGVRTSLFCACWPCLHRKVTSS